MLEEYKLYRVLRKENKGDGKINIWEKKFTVWIVSDDQFCKFPHMSFKDTYKSISHLFSDSGCEIAIWISY